VSQPVVRSACMGFLAHMFGQLSSKLLKKKKCLSFHDADLRQLRSWLPYRQECRFISRFCHDYCPVYLSCLLQIQYTTGATLFQDYSLV
jgi:hypothetical protein